MVIIFLSFQILKLIADILYKSPANNAFIAMVEKHEMDAGIANLIEDMSAKFAATDACQQFQVDLHKSNSKCRRKCGVNVGVSVEVSVGRVEVNVGRVG